MVVQTKERAMKKPQSEVVKIVEPAKLYLGRVAAPEGYTKVPLNTAEFSDGSFKLKNKNETVSEIVCEHLFHLIPGPFRGGFMDEISRALIKGGKITLSVPYYSHMRATQDFMHAWPPVSEASFLYFNKEWRSVNKIDYPLTCDFDYSYGYQVGPETSAKNDETRTFWIARYLNAVTDITVVLVKK